MRAIHDRYYASQPATFDELRWRLQLIAEEEVGVMHRRAHAREAAIASRVTEELRG